MIGLEPAIRISTTPREIFSGAPPHLRASLLIGVHLRFILAGPDIARAVPPKKEEVSADASR
jgi:hypothetical protein